MACRRGSVAPASARRCTIQLSRLQLALHNLPHSSKHVDVLELMMGRSMLDGQLPSGLSAWAVPLARAGTSSRVAGVAGRVGSVGVSLGRVPRCHGGPSRAGCGGGAFATRARYMGGGMGRCVVAERSLHASLGSGSLVIWFHWLLAPNRFIGSGRHAHGGWSSSWCEVARPSLRSVQVV